MAGRMNDSRQTALLCFLKVFFALIGAAAAGSRYNEAYPAAASKKGLQVEMVDDALALGIKHAALNFNLSQLIDPGANPANPSWESNGKTYHFQRSYLQGMDTQIKQLSDKGVLVNLVTLTYKSGNADINRILLHPKAVENPPNRLCNFNTVTEEGRDWLTAAMEFVAERWANPDRAHGRVSGYVVGNEVNSHWWWANMGQVGMQEFAADYLRTFRMIHGAVRRQASWARVYVSLEHHWNMRYPAGKQNQSFPGRSFLDYFAEKAREQGDFDWNLAFHPYPENLRNPRFWNDKTATTRDDTPRITFKNIGVLNEYMKRPEMLFDGSPRRIILSEQGFDTPKTPDGETVQAAAYCYAYKKIEALDGIDAFILHRHVDHPKEGGLLLGLRRWGEGKPKKKIYECFRLADTPGWEEAFRFALPVVGLKSWSE
jgi:hypothetical protein